jgi:hypothetical protein
MTGRAGRLALVCVVAACAAGVGIGLSVIGSPSAGAQTVSISASTERALLIASHATLSLQGVSTPMSNLRLVASSPVTRTTGEAPFEAYVPSSDTYYASVCAVERASGPRWNRVRGRRLAHLPEVSFPFCVVFAKSDAQRWQRVEPSFGCSHAADELRRLWPAIPSCGAPRPPEYQLGIERLSRR